MPTRTHRTACLASAASILALVLLAGVSPAGAQTGDNVLLVINDASPVSEKIASHYARTRGVPQENLVHIQVEANDEVARADYERLIEAPIGQWLMRTGAQDRILFIVLTKGVPLRIGGTSGRGGTVASVDSELALLYRKLTGIPVAASGPLPNPYFLGEAAVTQARLFSHQTHDIFLVTRLDGFTEADVLGVIDRGAAPAREGRIVLDGKAAWDDQGNKWLQAAADWLAAHGFKDRAVFDATSRVVTGEKDVLGYYSWGSNDPAIKVRRFGFTYAPGAIAAMFVSSDGRTFDEPPADWRIGTWENRSSFFANSPQSLAGDLIREGVTGVAGHVAEPYLDATIRPQILFPAYLSGFTLAEAFYLAMPYLSWQTVVVGDPLCAPFPRTGLSPSEIDQGLDAATEMPVFFGARRLEMAIAANRGAVKPEALKLTLRAEARMAKQDRPGARQALEEATALESRLGAAQLALGSMYEEAGEYDKAIERYRIVMAANPQNAVALNNLAYALAVRKNQPQDALPLAERAYALSNGHPSMADTLGWVQHLLGNEVEAAKLIAGAVKASPSSAELQFHLAAVLAATGALDEAQKALARALALDPSLDARADVKGLAEKLKGAK